MGGLILSPQTPRVAASFFQRCEPPQLADWQRQGLEVAELRLDLAAQMDKAFIGELIADYAALPTIVTLRAAHEGGGYSGEEAERQRLLCNLPAGDAVDIELSAKILPPVAEAVKAQKKTLIISRHNFTAADSAAALDDCMASALAAGADVVKCACLCIEETALQTLLDFAARCRRAKKTCIVIGMDDGSDSPYARQARWQLPQRGSCLAFAAIEQASAPGQLSLAETVAACRGDTVPPERFELPTN